LGVGTLKGIGTPRAWPVSRKVYTSHDSGGEPGQGQGQVPWARDKTALFNLFLKLKE
jgi:hypothetical protein